ncbi:MAG TPA: DUF1631 family protein, partial [Pseudomonadales bacterium]|nr:DUF1631 family protein [Pseudomonadales bacterium]
SEILGRVVAEHGIYSEKWRESIELYSGILWSTQADASDIGKREVLRRLPGIVQGVKRVATEQKLHPRVRDEILNQMIQIHLAIIRGMPGSELEDHHISGLDAFNSLQGEIFLQEEEEEVDVVALERAAKPVIQVVTKPEDASPNVYWRFDQISPFEDHEDAQDAEVSSEQNSDDVSLSTEVGEPEVFDAENEEEWSAIGLETGDQEMKRLFKLVGGMSVGSVIDINHKGKRRRCQLVKKSVALGQYTFRSFDTNEFVSMSKAQLVIAFIRGEAKRLGERSLFENSLETAVASIQRR